MITTANLNNGSTYFACWLLVIREAVVDIRIVVWRCKEELEALVDLPLFVCGLIPPRKLDIGVSYLTDCIQVQSEEGIYNCYYRKAQS